MCGFYLCYFAFLRKAGQLGKLMFYKKKFKIVSGKYYTSLLNFDEDFIIIETVSYRVGWANLELTESQLPLPPTC